MFKEIMTLPVRKRISMMMSFSKRPKKKKLDEASKKSKVAARLSLNLAFVNVVIDPLGPCQTWKKVLIVVIIETYNFQPEPEESLGQKGRKG
jgi:hypothetical protein